MAKIDRLTQLVGNEDVLWQDRKRYLGLPISFTKYRFDHDRFYCRKGLFNVSEDEILLYRVLDINIKRSFFQRIFGVGTIMLYTADQTSKSFEIKNIKNSERVKKALSTIFEKERDEKRILGKEMFGVSGALEVEDGVSHPIDMN